MNLENSEERKDRPWHFRFGILLAVLVGSIVTGMAIVSTQAAGFPHGGHGVRGHFAHDPELACDRAEFAVSWMLSRIDATEEQQTEVQAVIGRTPTASPEKVAGPASR